MDRTWLNCFILADFLGGFELRQPDAKYIKVLLITQAKTRARTKIKRTRGLTCATCSWQMKGDHVRKGRLERLLVAQLKYLPGCIESYKDCTACLSLWALVDHDSGVKTCQNHKIDQDRPKTSKNQWSKNEWNEHDWTVSFLQIFLVASNYVSQMQSTSKYFLSHKQRPEPALKSSERGAWLVQHVLGRWKGTMFAKGAWSACWWPSSNICQDVLSRIRIALLACHCELL